MRGLTSKACLGAALCLIVAHQARADSLRCGDKLIQKGDSIVTVQALCGIPASVVQSYTADNVPMEIWTYNRGPNQFLTVVRVINARVVEIKTLHQYGH